MTLSEKLGKVLGYEECDTEAYQQGNFVRSMNGYCLCADCATMTDEEVEARLGRSVYAEPAWLSSLVWQYWTDEQWETKAKEIQEKKNGREKNNDMGMKE